MIQGSPVNDDCKAAVVLDTYAMAWEPAIAAGVSRKVLDRVVHPRKGRETVLLKLEPGSQLPTEHREERVDIVVLEGSCEDEQGRYAKNTFVRDWPGVTRTLASAEGCTLYVRRRVPIRPHEHTLARDVVVVDPAKWETNPHRAGRGSHLYRDPNGLETARLVEVLAGRSIPIHHHPIGEETFILYGCLKDEHRDYTQGLWFRFPNGYAHAPFTSPEQPAGMLIREGDMVW